LLSAVPGEESFRRVRERSAHEKQVPCYYRPKPEDCALRFKEAIFAFDTNGLLNLYRYTALIVDWSNNNRSGAEYCSLVPCLPLARGLAP
jgi:hypothetical protein